MSEPSLYHQRDVCSFLLAITKYGMESCVHMCSTRLQSRCANFCTVLQIVLQTVLRIVLRIVLQTVLRIVLQVVLQTVLQTVLQIVLQTVLQVVLQIVLQVGRELLLFAHCIVLAFPLQVSGVEAACVLTHLWHLILTIQVTHSTPHFVSS